MKKSPYVCDLDLNSYLSNRGRKRAADTPWRCRPGGGVGREEGAAVTCVRLRRAAQVRGRRVSRRLTRLLYGHSGFWEIESLGDM